MKKPNFNWVGTWILPRVHLVMICAMVLGATSMFAQRSVSGKVTDSADGAAMEGVVIKQKGSNIGVVAGADGAYTINITNDNVTLVYSFIGYTDVEEVVAGRTNIDVAMKPTWFETDEQVITALGISRDKKALGYSVTEVEGESLTQARENNVVNGLAGRVAGVNVTSSAGGPAASTRVIIRGNAALGGNNQPLYVVDGIPIDNSNLGSAGMWGGKDLGDGISSINPDDIEKMTVLKGGAATALYGSRATNGVILITTKKGSTRKGIGVEINSNFVLEKPQQFYDFQQEYGSGSLGARPMNATESADFSRSSWGEKLGSGTFINFDGTELPYVANPDNMRDFYEDGRTFTNTVSLSGGNEMATFRLSASDLNNNGLVPESGLKRNTFTLRGTANLSKRLSTDVKVNYVREKAENRPGLSDTPENPGLNLVEMASNVPISSLQPWKEDDGSYIWWNSSQYRTNPYWGVYEQTNEDTKDRIIGMALAKYQFTDWLALQVRGGTDYYTLRQSDLDGPNTPYVPNGRLNENEWRVRENNYDFLLMFNKDITSDINLTVNAGGNRMNRQTERLGLYGEKFSNPLSLTVKGTEIQRTNYSFSQKKINSLYGSAQIGYKNYLYLDFSARNDWSSTLPVENNSYFYPSAGISFVFSDAFGLDESLLSFGKVRASYANVGGDTDPYNLALTYSINGLPHFGYPFGAITQNFIPNSELVPSSTNSIEFGADLRFFKNRLGIDFAWYNMETDKQIVRNSISQTTGYNSAVINTGNIRNRGIEMLITGTPVATKDFRWEIGVNFARNKNEVLTLNPQDTSLKSLRLAESRQRNAYVEARLGQPYGAIVGSAYKRDPSGNIVVGTDGLPQKADDNEILGVGVPDWTGGISNNISYKGINFGFLIDMRFGGEIHSMTNLRAYSTGVHQETLNGRDGIVFDGVVNTGTDEAPVYETNTVSVTAQDLYPHLASNIAEEFIYDASFIKMRQMTLGYTLPASLFTNIPVQGISFNLVGRNLFFLLNDVPNIDPESNYNNGNGQGLEYGTIPTVRSFGANLNVKF